jgi:hypothetical protein
MLVALSVTKHIQASSQARGRVADSISYVNRPDNLKVNIIYIIGYYGLNPQYI